MQDTRQNMLLELFSQIINENCYNQLRTQEQLGYIVFSGVRRSNGAQGLRVIVQSDRHPVYLDQRIESFLAGVDTMLTDMDEAEFKQHVEALASKRLEKPKKLSVRNGRYWSEILSQHYNFNRDEIEVLWQNMNMNSIIYNLTILIGWLSEGAFQGGCDPVLQAVHF